VVALKETFGEAQNLGQQHAPLRLWCEFAALVGRNRAQLDADLLGQPRHRQPPALARKGQPRGIEAGGDVHARRLMLMSMSGSCGGVGTASARSPSSGMDPSRMRSRHALTWPSSSIEI